MESEDKLLATIVIGIILFFIILALTKSYNDKILIEKCVKVLENTTITEFNKEIIEKVCNIK